MPPEIANEFCWAASSSIISKIKFDWGREQKDKRMMITRKKRIDQKYCFEKFFQTEDAFCQGSEVEDVYEMNNSRDSGKVWL